MADGSNLEYPRFHDLETLDNHIAQHKKEDDSRSILSSAVSKLWSSNSSLADLEKLSVEAHKAKDSGDTATFDRLQKQFAGTIDADKNSQESTNEFTHYASGFCKTMPLFIGGKQLLGKAGGFGLATTVLAYGLDRASLNDSQDVFAKKLVLGGLEGGLTKAAFFGLEKVKFENEAMQAIAHSPAFKGMALGMAARGINLSVEAALDPKVTGFSDGATKVLSQTLDGKALFTDAALFTVAHGTMRGGNWLTGGAFDARPLYQTVGMSTSFGLSNGAHHEYTRQVQAGEEINYTKILQRALLQGGIDAVAGIPGGVIADPKFRQRPLETLAEDARTARGRLDTLLQQGASSTNIVANSLVEGISGGAGPRPQFAFAMPMDGHTGGRTPGSVIPDRVHSVLPEPSAVAGGTKTEIKPAGERSTPPVPERSEAVGRDPVVEKEVRRPGEKEPLAADRVLTHAEQTASDHINVFKTGTASNADVVKFYEHLAAHPEVDAHMAELYKSNFDNPNVRRVIEGFYKPPVAIYNEPLLQHEQARQQLKQVYQYCTGNENVRLSPSLMAQGIRDFIAQGKTKGFDITPAIDHYGRVSHDAVIVKAIDIALGTDYSSLLTKFLPSVRSLPIAAAEMDGLSKAAQAVTRLAAGLERMPEAVAGDGKVEFVSKSGTRLSGEDVARVQALRDQAVASARTNLGGDATTARLAVMELSRYLDHPTAADWYPQWREQAARLVPLGSVLLSEPVKAMGDKAVVEFLGDKWPDCAAAGKNAGEQFRNKLILLDHIASRFMTADATSGAVKGTETAVKLLEAANSDPQSVRNIADCAQRGGEPYRNWVARNLEAGRPAAELHGDAALTAARLEAALPANPEIVAKLQSMAAADGNFKLGDLVHKMTHPKLGPDFTKLVLERASTEGVTTADLNADGLFTEMNVRKTFNRTPEAADKLVELGRSDSVGLQELVKDPFASQAPRGRGKPAPPTPEDQANKQLGFAYKDTIAALAPQAKSLAALQEVMMALKSGNMDRAFDIVVDNNMQPPGAEWHRTQLLMTAVAAKNADMIPPKPRNADGPGARPTGETTPRVPEPRVEKPPADKPPADKPPASGSTSVDPLDPHGTATKDGGLGGTRPPTGDSKLPDGRKDGGRLPGSLHLDDIMPVASGLVAGKAPTLTRPDLARLSGESPTPGVGKKTIDALFGEQPVSGTEKPAAPPEKVAPEVKPPEPPIEERISGWAKQLESGSPGERRAAARELAKHLNHESSVDWFDTWRAQAPDLLPAGFHLKATGVAELPPEVLFDALTAEQITPSQPAAGGSAPAEAAPAKDKPIRLEERLAIVGEAAKVLGADQTVLAAVLKNGANDLAGIKEITFRAGHPQYGEVYRQQLKAQIEAGQTDVRVLGRKSAIDEARVRRAFEPRAEDVVRNNVGPQLAEAGAAGKLDLRVVLDHLNSDYGEHYRQKVQERLAAGETDLTQFGRRTYMDEVRVAEALKFDPAINANEGTVDVGAEMAAAAARGEIDPRTLGNIVRNLNNPYCGKIYRQLLYDMGQVPEHTAAVLANEEFIFSASRAYRAFEGKPEVAQKLIDLTNEQRPVLKELMNGAPRDRALQNGYNAVIESLAPQATSIEQLTAVTKAMLQKKGDNAFDAAADIRPADDAAWLKTRQLIMAVAGEDPRAVQALLPPPPRQGGDRGGGDNRGAGNRGGGNRGGGNRGGGNRGGGQNDGSTNRQPEPPPDFSQSGDDGGGGKRGGSRRGGKDSRDRDRYDRENGEDGRWQ